MLKSPLQYLALALFLIVSSGPVLAESIPLDPDKWQAAADAKLNAVDGHLRVKALSSSLWLVPQKRIAYHAGDVLDVRYDLRGGNLIVQANWFDSAGQFLETTTLGKATFAEEQARFLITCSESLRGRCEAYELKLWVEADMPSLMLESLEIRSDATPLTLLSARDFEPSQKIALDEKPDGRLAFQLLGSEAIGSILTETRFDLDESKKLQLAVSYVAPSSAFSLQVIFWSQSGEYLGHADVVKDATGPIQQPIDFSQLVVPAGAAQYSFKFWLSGSRAYSAVLLTR